MSLRMRCVYWSMYDIGVVIANQTYGIKRVVSLKCKSAIGAGVEYIDKTIIIVGKRHE